MKSGRILSAKTATERDADGRLNFYVDVSIETAYGQRTDLRLHAESLEEQVKTFNYWGSLFEYSQNNLQKETK